MINDETLLHTTSGSKACGVSCISWTAILTGTLVGLGLTFLLQLFGMAIGLSAFTASSTGVATLAVGGFLGMLISVIVSMFAAGWVSGFLASAVCVNEKFGILYGFTTWCLTLLLTAWMSFHVTQLITAHYHNLPHQPATSVNASMSDTASTTANQVASISSKNSDNQAATQTEKNANTMGFAFFMVFILFFIGAISSCFGGYFGIKGCCERKRTLNT